MKKYLIIFTSLFSLPIEAAIYNYDSYVPHLLNNYFESIGLSEPRRFGRERYNECSPLYKNMLRDGVLDIRYALGYFDDSASGQEVRYAEVGYSGIKNYGFSPSLDIEIFHAIRNFLRSSCRTPNQVACEFRQSGSPQNGRVVLEKKVRIHGEKVLVRLTLTHASASESYRKNKTTLADRQSFLTQQSEDNFFGAFNTADVLFYNGHSRDGGGPDFKPPVLNRRNKPDYNNHYHVKKEGITRLLGEMKRRSDNDYILGLFACYSRRHYFNDLMRVNPAAKVILSLDEIDYFDSLLGSMGYLEGVLRGSCGRSLDRIARQNEKVRRGFDSLSTDLF